VDDFDVAIAAHALALEAVVVTDNVRHFRRVPGLAVESWSSGAKLGG
jgi:tRNA(fMet)-specific endonuclease VapC